MPVKVQVRNSASLESSLKTFKKMCAREGVLKQIKQKAEYEKPSDKRRRRQKEKEKAIRKAIRESMGTYR